MRALNYLATVLSVTPAASDRLESWFARSVVTSLRNVGILTLGDLVRFINLYGYRWHARIKSFGTRRAHRVIHWLHFQQEHLNLLISDAVLEPKSKRHLRRAAVLSVANAGVPTYSQFGAGTLVQTGLSRMDRSDRLAGQQGDFRSHMANTLGANNDLEAVNAWLSRYQEKPATQRSYRKEAERILLWCAQELAKVRIARGRDV